MKKNVYFKTLGCSKNDVDTDSMKTILEKDNYNIVNSPELANICVINTCGFIESAKKQSIEEIFNLVALKEFSDKKILVSGCLSERYSNELMEEIPEIDGILGTGQIKDIDEYIKLLEDGQKPNVTGDINAEIIEGLFKSNPQYSEYIKIGEGCNNFCAYCIIPKLKGKNRSRDIENILKEVEHLVKNGTREVILIAQNTTDYGVDNYGKSYLFKLLEELGKIDGLKWIRVLYLYPDNFNDELINEFKTNDLLVPYVDIPLQHVSDNVLKAMNRRTTKEEIKNLINKLRKEIPGIIIRSTFIVGFPGESEEDFQELLEFLEEMKLDRVGVFPYSREEGTKAYDMEGQVPEDVKEARRDKLVALQDKISFEKISETIGNKYQMIIDEIQEGYMAGRTYMDAPDIDAIVYVDGEFNELYKPGDFVEIEIVDTIEYDMIGELV